MPILKRTFLLLLAVFLTACTGAGTPVPTKAPATATLPLLPTPTLSAIVPTVAGEKCTVVSSLPEPNASEESTFPPVGENDWAKGPASAAVTFIEYSDFQ